MKQVKDKIETGTVVCTSRSLHKGEITKKEDVSTKELWKISINPPAASKISQVVGKKSKYDLNQFYIVQIDA